MLRINSYPLALRTKQLLSSLSDTRCDNRRYGFFTRTLIFCSAAAVMHYDVISRLLVALVNRYLVAPMVGYFDDFAAIARATIGQASLDAFSRFCSLLRVQLKEEKSEVWTASVFVGPLGAPPHAPLMCGNC